MNKCNPTPTQIIAKASRELLRGSYSVANEDLSNLSDTLRRWVGGCVCPTVAVCALPCLMC